MRPVAGEADEFDGTLISEVYLMVVIAISLRVWLSVVIFICNATK
jgi:hypothetical protein